jgi:quinol-cytochrome oxidoreductase complex cytochrome b subunit/mono/diheme cytochrome c family protein
LLRALSEWFEDRTGLVSLWRAHHEEPLPGGARWRNVFGPALAGMFLLQAFTGVLLMFSFSPSSSTAWSSVFYIKNELWLGWFIRGFHHFAAQTLIVLVPLHLLQVVWAGAYRRPRELSWWIGLALMLVLMAFALTGYLLPWDQKGYWHARVATNIMGSAPLAGPYILKLIVGGSDYGNQTVTRFYGMHVAVLPTLFIAALVAHVALYLRHGRTATDGSRPAPPADDHLAQRFRNTVFLAALVAFIVGLVLWEHGSGLEAPADPSSADYPARPEWYFLFLFQLLKQFPGKYEVVGTFVIPLVTLLVLISLPFFERVLPAGLACWLARGIVTTLVVGAAALVATALYQDTHDPLYQEGLRKAAAQRERANYLASLPDVGIPPEGSSYLLRRDPLTHGRAVLEKKCLGCHAYGGSGTGKQQAPELSLFGSRAWIAGLLKDPKAQAYFGTAPGCDGMLEWKRSSKLKPKQLELVVDFVATFASIPEDMTAEEWQNSPGVADHPGLAPFQKECGTCHVIPGMTEGGVRDAPELFAWGSPQWIARMIRKPGAADKYAFIEDKDRMPAFGADQLSANDLEMIIRYLKDDYPRPRPRRGDGTAPP